MKKLNCFSFGLIIFIFFLNACSGGGTPEPPTVTSISPTNSSLIGPVSISSLKGTNFTKKTEVRLVKSGEEDIAGSSVARSNSETLTCDFDLTGAAAGAWDVVITVPNGETVTLTEGFTVTNALYVSTTGNDSDAGTASAPKLTAAAAITAASTGQEIRIAAGTYSVAASIVLKEGVSLYGGYDPVTWERDISSHVSQLLGVQTTGGDVNIPETVITGSSTTGATIIDGLTITGSSSGADCPGAIYISNGSPVISNNIIHAGTGTGTGASIGIRAVGTCQPKIYYNTIHGGGETSGLTSSYAVYMNLVLSGTYIFGNVIHGGSNAVAHGIYMRQGAEAYICNNTIYGGGRTSGGHSTGIYCYNNSTGTFVIRNNTIDGGLGKSNYSYGIRIYLSNPSIDNNIIFSSGDNFAYGIHEDGTASDPVSINNNVIFSCGTALYYDEGSSDLTTIAAVNGITEADSNISTDPLFVDAAVRDWHLSSGSPASVTEGGLNGYDESWTVFPATGGQFIDKDLELRPASGTDWAIGAFQYTAP